MSAKRATPEEIVETTSLQKAGQQCCLGLNNRAKRVNGFKVEVIPQNVQVLFNKLLDEREMNNESNCLRVVWKQ